MYSLISPLYTDQNQKISTDTSLLSNQQSLFRFCQLSNNTLYRPKKKVFSSRILSRIIHYNSCHVSLVSVNLEQCLSISLSFMTLMFLKTTLPQHSDHIFLPWPECFFHSSSHQWDLLLRAWHFNKVLLTLVRGSSLYSIHCLH